MTGSELDVRARRRYVPDLEDFIGECELNYRRLMTLLSGGRKRRSIHLSDRHLFQLTVTEESRYTTSVDVRQSLGDETVPLTVADLSVRLYHDARLAEVVACTGMRHVRAVYDYPNPWMAQPDEKVQLNLFLGECLKECLRHGYEPMPADSV